MIAAIMQPYFFPYIGYFQLMKAVDQFVIYDDAQFMKGGWVNRNRIRINGKLVWLTLPVRRDKVSLRINERHYLLGSEVEKAKRRVQSGYSKAPAYPVVEPIISDLLDFSDNNVAKFNVNLLTKLAAILGIKCRFTASSGIVKLDDLRGQGRVIDLCRRIGADRYVNLIGGVELYDRTSFSDAGLDIVFLRTSVEPVQLDEAAAQLSIIDALMFNGIDGTKALLERYSLESGS